MSDVLLEKWDEVLNSEKVESITDLHKLRTTAQLLENQEKALMETASTVDANVGAGVVGNAFDPILIALVRRLAPKLIAYDIAGVQAMNMPTGIIFALRARYTNAAGAEAMGINEVDTSFSGTGTHSTGDTAWATVTTGTGIATATGETATFNSMSMTIEKITATAKTRQLRADYSLELSQDLKAVHGLDADNELSNILANEITNEINREVVRTIYSVAKNGAQWQGITVAGTFSCQADADGRWSAEKFKGLYYAIQRDANKIALESRRGKGNIVIVSADVASALAIAGVLAYAPALDAKIKIEDDPAGVTYVGTLGTLKVYIDPYLQFDAYVVGYKGASQFDAGLFYCPYVPLQMFRATDPTTFTPAIGFKSRYAMVSNPFVGASGALTANTNFYYRKVICTGISHA